MRKPLWFLIRSIKSSSVPVPYIFAASAAVMKGFFIVVVCFTGVFAVVPDVFVEVVVAVALALDDAVLVAVFIASEKLAPCEVAFVAVVENLGAFAVAFPIIMAVHRCCF